MPEPQFILFISFSQTICTVLAFQEQIKKFQLVCEEWTPDGGELSPTLKLKRKFVKQKYKRRFEQIYPA